MNWAEGLALTVSFLLHEVGGDTSVAGKQTFFGLVGTSPLQSGGFLGHGQLLLFTPTREPL